MSKYSALLKHPRMIILYIALIAAIIAMHPAPFNDGASIKSVARNSSASLAGMEGAQPGIAPVSRERIISVNGQPIHEASDYHAAVKDLKPNMTVQIETSRQVYRLVTRARTRTVELNETEEVTVQQTFEENTTINGTVQLVNVTRNTTEARRKMLVETLGTEDLGIRVENAAKTNLRKGLDLQGGTRVVLKPESPVSEDKMAQIIDGLKERLNVYGLSDLTVREARDRPTVLGEGTSYIVIEIAGATDEEVKELIARQGKFEAKIANQTVFSGGEDITYVCRTSDCAGIDTQRGCGQVQGGYSCGFQFSIALSPEAAARQADITKDLPLAAEGGERYITEQLVLYLDDQEVDRLRISADLRGRAVTDIAISGPGAGATTESAFQNALQNMKRLQTILITGSLPVKLSVVKIDTVSPVLGAAFLRNALMLTGLSFLVVFIILLAVYRSFKIAIPIILTAGAEILLLLGLYALISANLDLSAIAGIIIAVGTGVNDQIVITDEARHKESAAVVNWKQRIKRAFSVIFSAYATITVAMVPLLFAGAGLLKGFAITTILAVTMGVLITRQAYAVVVNTLVEE
ncbi:MMPL family transporter [Candidatus Woesearchaeota archaeon]|nr:MMPL family transporter [Candidatus Woesearchaeota archaeon]